MSDVLTYSSYLQLDELLKLQTQKSLGLHGPEHDEMLFIVIHQIYELWFKLLIHELDALQQHLYQNEAVRVSHTTSRIQAILRTIILQIDVLETMTPLEFNTFRSFLGSASGFQSLQFRELEFILGSKRQAHVVDTPKGQYGIDELRARYAQPTLWDAFLAYLAANDYPVPATLLERDVKQVVQASPELQEVLLTAYRSDVVVCGVCENLLDIDEKLQEWRYRHLKMVERIIGSKPGTWGSAGTQYLITTLKPFFPDLWAMRTLL
jgi:tryptophan 2,3-dioxygenase